MPLQQSRGEQYLKYCFVQLIQSFLFVATSKQYFTHYPLLQSIQNMSDYLQPTPQHQLKYRTTQNSTPSFKMWLVQLTEPIFPNPSAEECEASQNQTGGVSQNCLAACSFNLWFQYVLSGWEGSIVDMAMYCNAHTNDLPIPEGKIYLADAGFG